MAVEAERLVTGEGVAPDQVAVLVRSVRHEGATVGAALEERALPFRLSGSAAYFQRAEVRDVLAWLRLLADPTDSGAVVRALSRPPIELRSVDVARLTQLARRRRLDMPSAVAAGLEGPQLSPEGRERAAAFLKLYRSASNAFEDRRPDAFVMRLIERIGLRRQQVFARRADTAERLRNIAKLPELATAYMRREPGATPREFTRYLDAVAESGLREEEAPDPAAEPAVRVMTMHAAKGLEFDHVFVLGLSAGRMPGPWRKRSDGVPDELVPESVRSGEDRKAHEDEMRRLLHVSMTRARASLVLSFAERGDGTVRASPFVDEARAALRAEEEVMEEELFGPAEGLHSTFRLMRDELLDTVAEVGGRLAELRLDTYMDVAGGVARYLELLKVAALISRAREGQDLADALPGDQRGAGSGRNPRDPRAAGHLGAGRLAARRRPRGRAPARGRRRRLRALARPVHPAPRRGPDAVGLGHRHLPAVPAEVQVRARVPHPPGADDPPALRDRDPPGARALAPGRGRPDGAVRGRVAAQRLRRLRRRAPVPRARGGRAAPLRGGRGRQRCRAGLVRALVLVPDGARISCAAGWTGWTAIPTAPTS